VEEELMSATRTDPRELALLTIEDRVARITLNRPEARNALSLPLLEGLNLRVDELRGRTDVSVLVLAGEGKAFCAGMDLKSVMDDPDGAAALLASIAELTIKLRRLPQVVVGVVQGAAIGGGCGLACVCDLMATHPEAKLGYPEVDLGVCPAVVAPWLVEKIGAGRARQVLLMGGTFGGERALELGLATHLFERESLSAESEKIIERLASAAPRALRATRTWLAEMGGEAIETAVRRGAELSAEVVRGDEAQAGLRARFDGS
jgi:methylglutaconyl-CoA hydratase